MKMAINLCLCICAIPISVLNEPGEAPHVSSTITLDASSEAKSWLVLSRACSQLAIWYSVFLDDDISSISSGYQSLGLTICMGLEHS